ncbi:MAG: hypothetical protein E2576_24120 [Alcaligenaceae bacterium]|nr:hypothetical protein [Alcaligenaceae bacterium SAGV5]MPS54691.1 hypothetical protein [Alcaligenaceae bacterium SAGV3]MPT59823.1 hypothetical protein [Alcaligenaceae bacterium]
MEKVEHNLYDRREQFDAWEAACLIAGFEPASIDRKDQHSVPSRVRTLLSMIDEAYRAALLVSKAHVYDENGAPVECQLSDVSVGLAMLPSVGLRGAYSHEGQAADDTYEDTRSSARTPKFWRKDIEKWLTNIGWKEARYFVAQQESREKTLASRERDSLLKLVIGMAVGGYGHNVEEEKQKTVTLIMQDMERIGLSLSDETIRKYLKEATELLPGKPHKD